MSRDDAALLDVAIAGNRVIAFAQSMSRLDLETDVMRLSAILYQIQIMGEAIKRLSQDFRERHSDIPWGRAAGMRDIIAHQYDRLDLDIIWNVIHKSTPELLEMITPLLPEEPSL